MGGPKKPEIYVSPGYQDFLKLVSYESKDAESLCESLWLGMHFLSRGLNCLDTDRRI